MTIKRACGILFCLTIVVAYIVPIEYITDIGLANIDKIVYTLACVLVLCGYYSHHKMSTSDGIYIVLLLCSSILAKDFTRLHLLSLIAVQILIAGKGYFFEILLNHRRLLVVASFMIFVYSFVHHADGARWVSSSVKDPNLSGFIIFIIGILLYKTNKILALVIFCTGFATLSRGYLISTLLFFLISVFNFSTKIKLARCLSFFGLCIVSIIALILLSFFFKILLASGKILDYGVGVYDRFGIWFDYSNYHRFTANTNLIEIYIDKPWLLITGMNNEEFFNENFDLVMSSEFGLYRAIHPHNFFFSCLQHYGFFSIIILFRLNSIFNKLLNCNNICIFIPIFIFATFLGVGFSGYYLWLVVFTMVIYERSN